MIARRTQSEEKSDSFVASVIGIQRDEISFGMRTTHKLTGESRGKQPVQCFWPFSRQPLPGQKPDWPTLVIETGVIESIPRLREDASWWFRNSSGMVRIVLLVCISHRLRKTTIEKWHLAPPDTPNPLTRALLNQFQLNQPPPVVQQPVALQQPYAAQIITIDPVSVQGAPLSLNFEALFDRNRQGDEIDIVLDANNLHHCTRTV